MIITKPRVSPLIIFVLIVLLALFLRLYRIGELTEFLGDQGRTGIHIYNAWKVRQPPLVGPTVLTGEHLGPAFYYLMAPAFVIGRFNPVWPAVATALFGVASVVLLWMLGERLFGWKMASVTSLLYAVSPQIVRQERILWEPNLIPFFALLYVFSVCKIMKEGKLGYFALTGVSVGILIQLHYPNLVFIPLTVLASIWMWFARRLFNWRIKFLVGAYIFGLLVFFVVLAPFLYYEVMQGFVDLAGIAKVVFSSGQELLPKGVILHNFLDYAGRIIGRVVPLGSQWQIAFVLLIIAGVNVLIKDPILLISTLLFLGGISVLSFYKGVVYNHYLNFLLPIPFLGIGYIAYALRKKVPYAIVACALLVLAVMHLTKTDIFQPGFNDIARTKRAVEAMIQEANGEPFSFTLISSRSFSDLHYRYFFKIKGVQPQPITSNDYTRLFLVCEKGTCPTSDELLKQKQIRALCYEDNCQGEYPYIFIDQWKPVSYKTLPQATLYSLIRNRR